MKTAMSFIAGLTAFKVSRIAVGNILKDYDTGIGIKIGLTIIELVIADKTFDMVNASMDKYKIEIVKGDDQND
jgi:hypothetical protein